MKVLELDDRTFQAGMHDLEFTYSVFRKTGSMYRFDHARIQETIYNRLESGLKQNLHRQTALLIEKECCTALAKNLFSNFIA